MLYELYEKKILKIRHIKATIGKYKILIIIASCLLFLSACSFLYCKGMIVSDIGEIGSVVYGEEPNLDATVFCGKAEYEYSSDGESWSSVKPYLPGKYNVRAVSKRTFGIKETGDSVSLEIVKKNVNVLYSNTTVTYGDDVDISAELAYNDRIVGYKTLYDNEALGETAARIGKDSITVENDNGEDVTNAYEFIINECNVTIVPRPITITSGSDIKTYDGKPLICHSFDYSYGSLAKNDNAVATYGSSITEAGNTDNTFTVRIGNVNGEDVTENYSVTYDYGKLSVSKREITVYPEYCEKTYDGTAITEARCVLSSDSPYGIVDGHSIKIETQADSSDVDASINTIVKCAVYDGDIDVTENYAVAFKTGKVTINKRPITIYPEYCEKTYDGTAITEARCVLSFDSPYGIVDGHSIKIETQAVSPDVNATENQIIRYNITENSGKDVTENYDVTFKTGKVTIKTRDIYITAGSATKTYDKTPLTCGDIAIDNLLSEHRIVGSIATQGSITFAGTADNILVCSDNLRIIDGNDIDVTNNYNAIKKNGTLTVEPKPIRITFFEKEKEYDGEAFTTPSKADFWWSDGNMKLLDGDTLTFEEIYFTDQQGNRVEEEPRNVGVYLVKANVTIKDENEEDVSGCYKVEYSGKMEIKKRLMKFTVDCVKDEYNFSDLRCIYNSLPSGHTMQCEDEDMSSNDIREVIKGIKVTSNAVEVTENFDFEFVQNDLSE